MNSLYNSMGNRTSIPVSQSTRDQLQAIRPEGEYPNWDTFLLELALHWRDTRGDGEMTLPSGADVTFEPTVTEDDIEELETLIDHIPERTAELLEQRFR